MTASDPMESGRPARAGSWTEQARRILSERYLARGEQGVETPEQMCWRVATAIAAAEATWGKDERQRHELATRFYELMVDGLFLPNSPTLMNAGKGTKLQYSACYVLPIGDSMEEIFDAVKAAAVVHQSGGGTGFAFSRLRPKNALVSSTGGKSSGPVSFLRVFDGATEAVKQGGARRGANMGVLRVDHPDVLEFVECKLDGSITNFNISVAITDRFMEALDRGEDYQLVAPHTKQVTGRLPARDVFQRIVRAAWQSGDPGLVFIDRINASRANPTPEVGLIEATNPCIAGDALVGTSRGLLRMESLGGEHQARGVRVDVHERLLPAAVMVADGTSAAVLGGAAFRSLPISAASCSGVRETVVLRTRMGLELACTPDHRIMTERGWVPAGELTIGVDRVLVRSDPGAFGVDGRLPFAVKNVFRSDNGRTSRHAMPSRWSRNLGIVLGWLVGDGWLRFGDGDRRVGFTFGPDDASMLVRIKTSTDRWYGRAVAAVPRKGGVIHLSYHGKYFVDFFRQLGVSADGAALKIVPETLFSAPRSAVVGFLQGLFTADGTVRANKKANSEWVALTSKSRPLLQGVQLLLLNLGIKSSIFDRSRAARPDCFSYRSIGGELRTYASDGVLYELAICGRSRETFRREVGFLNQKQRALDAVRFSRFYREKLTDTVVSREPGGARPVYDLTEPQTRSMIVNGIVVHNCGEQPLLPMEACNLGSVDVSKLARRDEAGAWSVDWERLDQVVRSSVRFLDDVIECNPYPLPEIDSMVKSNRRIGIGVMGWADLLFRLGIPYDSEEALVLGDRLMATLQVTGHDESARLAEERGAFPNWQRSIYRDAAPRRNATVTTVAPTGTISIIAGCSSGIEPAFAISYTHHVGERVLSFVNRVFEEVARERGFWSEELMAEVARRGGVRGLPAVPDDVQQVFVTAHEVPYEWHVRHQAAFQKWTDNGVSKTINLPHEATLEDVRRAYLLAWELGCLGITVFREGSKPGVLRVGAPSQDNGAAVRPLDAISAVPGETDALAVTPRAAVAAPASTSRGGVLEPRPASLHGTTHRVQTPLGTAYVVVNEDRDGEPFEVFVSVGKAGTDTMAVAEAIGRLVSLALRMPSSVSPRARLAEIVEQLSGIGGARPLGFGNERVLSLPDGIAQALARHLGSAVVRRAGDICPECGAAALVREEGCAKCHACGFSEC